MIGAGRHRLLPSWTLDVGEDLPTDICHPCAGDHRWPEANFLQDQGQERSLDRHLLTGQAAPGGFAAALAGLALRLLGIGLPSIFPNSTFQATNYWVDVLFQSDSAPSPTSILTSTPSPTSALTPTPTGTITYSVREDGTILQNGVPVLPFGFYNVVQQSPDSTRIQYDTELATAGFDVDFLSGGDAVIDSGTAHNMKMIVAFDYNNRSAIISEYGSKLGVFAWNTGDDINLQESPSQALASYQGVKTIDPNHLIAGSYSGWYENPIAGYFGTSDIMINYAYPIHDGGSEELEWGAASRKYMYQQLQASGKNHISLWTAEQAFSYAEEGGQSGYRYPTAGELRNLIYSALVYGHKGFCLYRYANDNFNAYLPTSSPEVWNEAKLLRTEVAQLAPILLNGVYTLIDTGTSYLHAAVWQYNNTSYVIVVNTYRLGSRSVSVPLPSSVTGSAVPFFSSGPTGMTFNNSTKVLSGTVNNDEVHVYKISATP